MAYQFHHSKLARIDREYSMAQAIAKVNDFMRESGLPGSATWDSLNLESWHSVGAQVLSSINTSAIFLADISELNPNVLFELGFAVGVRERVGTFDVHLLAHESLDIRSLPSDILGKYVVRYTGETFQPIVARLLRDSLTRMAPELSTAAAEFAWRDLWALDEATTVDLICSEIPDQERPAFARHDHPNYLRYAKFADLDSLVYVHNICATCFPRVKVRDYGASESIAEHTNAILIGGAAWNSRVRRLQQFMPVKFVDAKHDETDSLLVEVPGANLIFETLFTPLGVATSDYFVFASLRPDGTSRLLFFGGGLTHGVLGGIKTFDRSARGLSNAEFLRNTVADAAETIVIGRVDHRDGYLKVPDFTRTKPCLVLRREDTEFQFTPVVSACNCDLHRTL
jgi:hypothetical protein